MTNIMGFNHKITFTYIYSYAIIISVKEMLSTMTDIDTYKAELFNAYCDYSRTMSKLSYIVRQFVMPQEPDSYYNVQHAFNGLASFKDDSGIVRYAFKKNGIVNIFTVIKSLKNHKNHHAKNELHDFKALYYSWFDQWCVHVRNKPYLKFIPAEHQDFSNVKKTVLDKYNEFADVQKSVLSNRIKDIQRESQINVLKHLGFKKAQLNTCKHVKIPF